MCYRNVGRFSNCYIVYVIVGVNEISMIWTEETEYYLEEALISFCFCFLPASVLLNESNSMLAKSLTNMDEIFVLIQKPIGRGGGACVCYCTC